MCCRDDLFLRSFEGYLIFISLIVLQIGGHKHQNNPLVIAIRHSNPFIIYIYNTVKFLISVEA